MFSGLMIIFGFNDFMRGAVAAINDILAREPGEVTFEWSSNYVLPFFSAVFFLWGLSRIVFALDAERMSRKKRNREAHSLGSPVPAQVSGSSPIALPQSQSVPLVEPGRQRLDTVQLTEPPTVTEETTKPLKK